MKVIDVNTSLGPQISPCRYYDEEGLIRYMDDYRITTSVAYHSAAQMTPWQYNEKMSQIAEMSNGRIQACHVLDPMLDEKSETGNGALLERLKASRPTAVRMLPKTQGYPLNAFFCDYILGVLNELQLPLLLDADEMPDFSDIPPLAKDFPNLPIVILRHYFLCSRSLTPLLTKLQNVYIDINTIVDTGYVDELVNERCGSKNLLFGSGLPHHVPAGGLSLILYSTMDDSDKQSILHGNWERLQKEIRYDYTR